MKGSGETVEMPIGMAMLVAQSPEAINAFGKLSEKEQALLINKAKAVHSREEMTRLVAELAKK